MLCVVDIMYCLPNDIYLAHYMCNVYNYLGS